jgi:acyl carrier protein
MKKLTQEEKDEVKEIVTNIFSFGTNKIKDDSKLTMDLGIDEFDSIELVIEIEKKFDCSISDIEWENVKTISDIYTCLERNIK